jgi:DNA-binding NtrC family response regulator
MFDLRRLFHLRSQDWDPRRADREPRPGSGRVRLLAIIPGSDDQTAIRRIAVDHGWDVSFAGSSATAQTLLEREPAPLVVICDRDLPNEYWRAVVAAMASQAPCVLLASRVADGYLWEEVIKHKGYDVVNKPFEAAQLRRLVSAAESRAHWRGRLPA